MRLRFRCEQVDASGPTGSSVTLTPLAVGSDENPLVFAAQPAGKILLESLRADASKLFRTGADYVIEIAEAHPETAPADGETNPPSGETPPPNT